MDRETPSSSYQMHNPSKRILTIMDEKEYHANKKRKMSDPDHFENVDGDPPEVAVKKASLEQMLTILNVKGYFNAPRKQEPIAIITPFKTDYKPILIEGSVSFGKSSSCDIDLTKYGICENISDHHATITYDKMTKLFELLNYSRTVTFVDNIAYSNGLSSSAVTSKGLKKEVKDFVASKRRKEMNDALELREGELNDVCILRKGKVVQPCDVSHHCKSALSGYAIVRHGTLLRFGCIEFVFSCL